MMSLKRHMGSLKHNHKLLLEWSTQQLQMDIHYDYDRKGLRNIVTVHPKYFQFYVDTFYCAKNDLERDTHDHLSFIWDIPHSNKLVKLAINSIIDSTLYWGMSETLLNNFFRELNDAQKDKAHLFVHSYIAEFHRNENYMDGIFDVLNNAFSEYFEEEFKYFLSIESDVEVFKKIAWIGRGGTSFGEVIIGEIQAGKWQKILSLVDGCNDTVKLIPIKHFVKDRIAAEIKSAEYERKRQFMDPMLK